VGLYAILIQVVGNSKVSVLLFALPVGLGLVLVPDSKRVLMALLVLSLSFSARFRLTPGGEFQAGAEASIAPMDVPLLILAALAFAELCLSPRKLRLRLRRFGITFALLLLVYLLSLVRSPNRSLALLQVVRLLRMGLLVLVIKYYVRNRQDVVFVASLLLISVILQGALAVIQTLFHTSLGLGFLGERDTVWVISYGGVSISRAGGTMGHANALACYIEALVPLALALLIARVRGTLRILSLIALPVGMIGLFLTFSRAGWGASLIGLAAVLLLSGVLGVTRRSKVLIVTLLVAIGLGMTIAVLWNVISQRVSVFGSNSWLVRTGTVQVALEMIRQNPWLGVGVNNYMAVAPDYVPFDMHAMFGELIAHNLFYLVAAETGFVGLLAFVALLWATVAEGYRAAKAKCAPLSHVAIGILGGIVALLAHGMFDWLFFYDPIYVLFWFQAGLLLAIRDIVAQNPIPKPSETGRPI
jgi:O-antigen ligase